MNLSESLAQGLSACRMVDLSSDVTVHEPGPFGTSIDTVDAVTGAQILCDTVAARIVPETAGRLRPEHFPDRAFLSHEMVRASVHAGSHIDAPGHYGPQADGSRGHINDAPPDIFVSRGVMLDVSGIDGWQVELRHVKAAVGAATVDRIDGSIVLLHTEPDKAIAADAVGFLLDAGVRVIGTDADGFDGSFEAILRRFVDTGDPATLWPAHLIGRRRPYYQIERLRNLHLLPPSGFVVMALPVLIEGAMAAWTRAVAFVPPNTETSRTETSRGDE
jgi:cyclase